MEARQERSRSSPPTAILAIATGDGMAARVFLELEPALARNGAIASNSVFAEPRGYCTCGSKGFAFDFKQMNRSIARPVNQRNQALQYL